MLISLFYRGYLFQLSFIGKSNWKIQLEKSILFIENKYEY